MLLQREGAQRSPDFATPVLSWSRPIFTVAPVGQVAVSVSRSILAFRVHPALFRRRLGLQLRVDLGICEEGRELVGPLGRVSMDRRPCGLRLVGLAHRPVRRIRQIDDEIFCDARVVGVALARHCPHFALGAVS
jgi:hypothetical protein